MVVILLWLDEKNVNLFDLGSRKERTVEMWPSILVKDRVWLILVMFLL